MGKRAPSLWAWTPTAWGPEEPPFPRKHKQRLKHHAGSSRWSTAMISELMVLQWPVRCPASGLITRQGLVGDTQNSSETAGLQMESIFICNRINNNTGLKPTDTTGLCFQPLQADHWIQGMASFLCFQARQNFHETAGLLDCLQGIYLWCICPANDRLPEVQGSKRKNEKIQSGRKSRGFLPFWLKKKKTKGLQIKHQYLKNGLRGSGGGVWETGRR